MSWHFNDDGSTDITYSDGSVEHEAPKGKKGEDIQFSRKATGDTVTISKGEMAKLHANYAGEKTFAKKDVVEALKSVEALKVLPAARRAEIANEIWKGYNQRLHQQDFEKIREQAVEVLWRGCVTVPRLTSARSCRGRRRHGACREGDCQTP